MDNSDIIDKAIELVTSMAIPSLNSPLLQMDVSHIQVPDNAEFVYEVQSSTST